MSVFIFCLAHKKFSAYSCRFQAFSCRFPVCIWQNLAYQTG